MALYVSENGAKRTIDALYTAENGTVKQIVTAYTKASGALCPIFAKGKMLHEMSVGDTVTITEGEGSALYRIWHKGYLDTEAVLLVREYVLPTPMAYAVPAANYNESAVDAYLQETFLPTLDATLQEKLISVDLPMIAREKNGFGTVFYEKRSCFLLSANELGGDVSGILDVPSDGPWLEYHQIRSEALGSMEPPRYTFDVNGVRRDWWLRSAYPSLNSAPNHQCYCDDYGYLLHGTMDAVYYLRPALAVDPRYIPM